MNLQRISALTKKELIRMLKDPAILFMVIVFPIVLTLAFGFAFGKFGGNDNQTYTVAVINQDQNSAHGEWSAYFIGNLSTNELLKTNLYTDNVTAQQDLQQGKLSGIIIIPAGFGEAINSYYANPSNTAAWTNVTIDLTVDQGSLMATQVLKPVVQQTLLGTIFGPEALSTPLPVQIGTPALVEAEFISQFDYMGPGVFAFAAIFLIMTVAQGITEEREQKLLKRIFLTPTTSAELMTAESLANMTAATLQTCFIMLAAYLIGYRPHTDIAGLIMAFVLMLVFSFCCVGFGLIVGAISKNSGAATGFSFVFILPLMFLGTFVTIGEPTIANKIMPSWYVSETIKSLFLRGAAWNSSIVLNNLGIIALFSIVVFLLGIIAFQKFGKK